MFTRTTRRTTAIAVTAFLCVGVLAGCISADQQTAQTLMNADRTANGRAALVDYAPADTKAQAWADHLAAQTVNPNNPGASLSHSNLPDGYAAGSWCNLGENVGMGPSVAAIEPSFMASPTHRANILNPAYDSIGTGVATNAATGYVFVVQEFVNVC